MEEAQAISCLCILGAAPITDTDHMNYAAADMWQPSSQIRLPLSLIGCRNWDDANVDAAPGVVLGTIGVGSVSGWYAFVVAASVQ